MRVKRISQKKKAIDYKIRGKQEPLAYQLSISPHASEEKGKILRGEKKPSGILGAAQRGVEREQKTLFSDRVRKGKRGLRRRMGEEKKPFLRRSD